MERKLKGSSCVPAVASEQSSSDRFAWKLKGHMSCDSIKQRYCPFNSLYLPFNFPLTSII